MVFNGHGCLERTIESVLNQTYSNIEYIVIDGGSTDGTLDIIKKYEDKIDYWISEKDEGIYDAMNKGILLAKGDSVNLLNCGDTLLPKTLAEIALLNNLQDIVVYGDYYRNYYDLDMKRRDISTMRYWEGMTICHQSMFIGKNIYKKYGLYLKNYRLASDYEMLLRLVKADVEFKKIDMPLVDFMADGLTTSNMYDSIQEASKINLEYFGKYSIKHFHFLMVNFKNLFFFRLKTLLMILVGSVMTKRIRKIQKKFGL